MPRVRHGILDLTPDSRPHCICLSPDPNRGPLGSSTAATVMRRGLVNARSGAQPTSDACHGSMPRFPNGGRLLTLLEESGGHVLHCTRPVFFTFDDLIYLTYLNRRKFRTRRLSLRSLVSATRGQYPPSTNSRARDSNYNWSSSQLLPMTAPFPIPHSSFFQLYRRSPRP